MYKELKLLMSHLLIRVTRETSRVFVIKYPYIGVELNLLLLWREKKNEEPEKKPQSKDENQQQTQLT